MAFAFRFSLMAMAAPLVLAAQINVTGVSTTTTQAILQYTSPTAGACSLRVADMDRLIMLTSGTQASGQVTIQTNAPHGLLAGAVVYMENSGVAAWNGWQTIISVPSQASFTFANATSGAATGGNAGVLVDDVNPALFPGADRDSRPGSITNGQTPVAGQTNSAVVEAGRTRTFVVGLRYAQFASDGSRYSRALQANARHHYTLTCGTQSFDNEFQTQNIPLGDTHNEGPLADRNNPGQYAYPTIQWSNRSQALIDPVTGLRSTRATGPAGTPSGVQTFVTALNPGSWTNPNGPLTPGGGAATYTGGTCGTPGPSCALFLRADTLNLFGGATYTAAGWSLDWFQVTALLSINNGSCTGNDCKVSYCLTVDGVTCSSAVFDSAALATTPTNYAVGSQNLMDLWQGSGPPQISVVDVSQGKGTVNYTAASRTLAYTTTYLPTPFNIKWGAGSTVTIAGTQYPVASVQSELQLTLASGPGSNLSGATYSANNFGFLVWKKTATADTVSVGYTTYQYGYSGMPSWPAKAQNPCSPVVVASGIPGFNCFQGGELYWIAADGSDSRDLGYPGEWYAGYNNYAFSSGYGCGNSNDNYQFDPQNGDIWYCFQPVYFDSTRLALVQAHYLGNHARNPAPGAQFPDCSVNGGIQPCVLYTIMNPSYSQAISQHSPGFNPDYAASGFTSGSWSFMGISADGDAGFFVTASGQDWPGWVFLWSLGDRTPMGTDSGSFNIVAGSSTYRKPPASWCTIHSSSPPDAGWVVIQNNTMQVDGAKGTYQTTLTSASLNTTNGVAGGLNACPANPFGVTGNICTSITINAAPISAYDGSTLQNVQVGDFMAIDGEYVRVLTMSGSTAMTVQRGASVTAIAGHSSTIFNMMCGSRNDVGNQVFEWNYRSDPYGLNSSWNTVVSEPTLLNGHSYIGGGIPVPTVTVSAGGGPLNGALLTQCPASIVTNYGGCTQVKAGWISTALASPSMAVSLNPPFAGTVGSVGAPNGVDSHPGPCFLGFCMDARGMDGDNGSNNTVAYGSSFTNVAGQLWKFPANTTLHRKLFNTMAYVGRAPLVDVSGPASAGVFGPTSANSYEYCIVLIAGECMSGSAVGDIYVNAPYVSYPYCAYPGIAVQADDANALCMGDLGAYTGNIVQAGYSRNDVFGAGNRRLGPNYARWKQFNVYWNASAFPNGLGMLSWGRWLDGIRSDDLSSILPPFPASDGVARGTFLPIAVTIDPPNGFPAESAIVEFGYAENGDPGSYYCTSRQETCVAVSGAINLSTPFYFEQSESYTGVSVSSCPPGPTGSPRCTIAIPALSQRVLYYRWKYLNSAGQVVGPNQDVHVTVTQ